ncbi:MAG: hypothetical protein LQ350_004557 [Teloschistes chrysophthalmus]|nr:MAG: hypothetical protein LQ350_004557 [Niorma chrysophthalma]
MSESPLSDAPVPDVHLETALRQAVKQLYTVDPEQITVKKIRTNVEQDLELDPGFFKDDPSWNTRSKQVIQSEVDIQEAQSQPPSSQPAPIPSHSTGAGPSSKDARKGNGKKRPSISSEGPKKPPKTRKPNKSSTNDNVNQSLEPAAAEAGSDQSKSSSPLSEIDFKEANTAREEKPSKAAADQASESELSSLIDEGPKPKKKGRKASLEKPKSKKKDGLKRAKAPQQPADPDTEEIKRLQGWLVKCGIRKMWFKELAPYDTPRAKIRHLKDMLAEAGMTGRYSQEKATQIRDERELKADLADVQAGNKHWGKAESEEKSEEGEKPRRRLARGLQELDFLKDDEGEESD